MHKLIPKAIIDETYISGILAPPLTVDDGKVQDILERAKTLQGLELADIATLSNLSDPHHLDALFATANWVKNEIYGRRLVIFAPLYVSNLCVNECLYCAFRAKNKAIYRRSLSRNEIRQETAQLINQGHKRILLVAGESYPRQGFNYILDAIDTIYQTKSGTGDIRRINVNVAPLSLDEFRALKERNIGTYQLFQETYHRQTYGQVHISGKKQDYDYRLTALNRAMEAGIDDVGIGVLFGLTDWRFELIAMMQHISHLENKFGVGPHTISVPRLEPASGSDIAMNPPHPVSDIDFQKIVAILRLAVPYTGIIMSTRETARMRRETFALGVSQISAGSRTNPGGYSNQAEVSGDQFSLGDHRSLDEVILDIIKLGYTPSFCTGCYRLGRTGTDFMDLAKPGEIKAHCAPNALSTFAEYLEDYASEETRTKGYKYIERAIPKMDSITAKRSRTMVDKVKKGKRDVYC